jgi:hypothetical protein
MILNELKNAINSIARKYDQSKLVNENGDEIFINIGFGAKTILKRGVSSGEDVIVIEVVEEMI